MEKLSLINLSKSFDRFKAVDNISIEINPGELYSFLGPSGCGKTTILRMIAGFETPSAGSIYLGNTNITSLPPYKRKVNTIFQNYSLFPHLTLFDNVAFGLRMKKISKPEIKDRVYEMLGLVKMESEVNKYPSQISGGQKQRIAIARALINSPEILLLDEPLAALDLKLRQHMLIELMNIHDKVGITFVYVTHDQGEAISFSDRVAVMNEGKIVQEGSPDEIYEKPNSIFSAQFIGDTNLISGEIISTTEEYVTINAEYQDGMNFQIDSNYETLPPEGSIVSVSIRPEKIAVSRKEPDIKDEFNIIEGIVEDILYMGTHTQYIIKAGELRFKVFSQHKKVYDDDAEFDWDEKVFLYWHDSDSYLINEPHKNDSNTNDEQDFERGL